jgi:hypothetical protein
MAYKQPYKQVSKSNDGASVAFLAAIPAIIKGIAAAGKGIAIGAKAAKGATAVAKGVKAGKLAAKAGKLTAKAKKIGETTKKGAKLIEKAGKVTERSGKVFEKGSKAMEKASNWGKKAEKMAQMSNKASEGTTKLQKGISNIGDKIDKTAGKIGEATGMEADAVKELGMNAGQTAVSNIQSKIQEGKEQQPAERSTPNILPKQVSGGGYEDPQGPNMFEHRKNYGPSIKSKYDNVGPSMKEIKTTTADGGEVIHRSDGASSKFGTKSETEDNLYKDGFGETTLGNFEAPITIKGVTFDAGDVLRLTMMGYEAGKKGIEKRKANAPQRKEDKRIKKGDRLKNATFSFTKDKLIDKKKQNVGPIAKPTTTTVKGKEHSNKSVVTKVAGINRKDQLTKGIKPSYKK